MVDTMKDQARGSTPGRRHHERKFKDELIARSLLPGASVAAIAMEAGVNANLLFKWRRLRAQESAPAALQAATLLPICVIPDVPATLRIHPGTPLGHATVASNSSAAPCAIEIDIAGAQLRLRGPVDEAMLGSVLRALRHTA